MSSFINSKNFKIKSIFAFVVFTLIFFGIDWLTKQFLFDATKVDWNNQGRYRDGTEKNYFLLGVRSVAHNNSTFFSFLNFKIPDWVYYLFTFISSTFFLVIPFFTKSIFLAVTCGITFSGVIGNSLDKLFSNASSYYQYLGSFVRDIFYLPWLDRGTFNFADVSIITGTVCFIIYIIAHFKDHKKEIQ